MNFKPKFKFTPLNKFGIEWSLPIIALALIDPSVAMLLTMFVAPPVVVVIALILTALHVSGISQTQGSVGKLIGMGLWTLRAMSVILALGIFAFLVSNFLLVSPAEIFAKTILNPIPKSVKVIKHGGGISAMGSSSFYIAFDATSEDLQNIIARRFSYFTKSNVKNLSGRKPELYRRVVDEAQSYFPDASEIYIYEHTNSQYRFDALVVNRTHTKAYYRSF